MKIFKELITTNKFTFEKIRNKAHRFANSYRKLFKKESPLKIILRHLIDFPDFVFIHPVIYIMEGWLSG